MNIKSKHSHSSYISSETNSEFLQNWIELSTTALKNNIAQFQEWLGPQTQITPIIKSNAYGHGLIEMAELYEQCHNITALCVVNLTEALIIRKETHCKKPIFVIGYLDAPYDLIPGKTIEVIIYDLIIAQKLNEIGKKYQEQIKVHIKFDTGMSRLGVVAEELNDFIYEIEKLKWLSIAGIFTHFAESYNRERTHQQETLFIHALKFNYKTHACNSHGALTNQYKKYSFARIGIGLFGYLQKESKEIQSKLQPVLSLKTKILQIKPIKAGSLVGYDGLFKAPIDMTIAIIAIGYHEGLDARLSNLGSVIVNGQLAPIIGRICMNLTIIDISTITNCTTGQTVTLLGKDGKITISAYDWSSLTKASVYNHLTKLSASIPKIIIP